MSDYAKVAAEMGDRYLAALAVRQESFLKYLAATRSLAAQTPAFPMASAAIETTHQLNGAQFELASRLLAQQKQFFDTLFEQQAHATTAFVNKPTVQKSEAPAKKASGKRAAGTASTRKTKASSKKASSRKKTSPKRS